MAAKSVIRWCGGVTAMRMGALLLPLLTTESVRAARVFDDDTSALAVQVAVQKAREVAALAQGQNNLQQIAIAMHHYVTAMGIRFPPQATYDKKGKAMLSWRVLILPYIDQADLYKQFHLDEPWDSEHNKKLLPKMPKVYAAPQDEKTAKEHTTYYQGFLGKGTFFEGKRGIRPLDIIDGSTNTIMLVEASKAAPVDQAGRHRLRSGQAAAQARHTWGPQFLGGILRRLDSPYHSADVGANAACGHHAE